MNIVKNEFKRIREPFYTVLPYLVGFNAILFKEGRELVGTTIIIMIAGLMGTIIRNSRWATVAYLVLMIEIAVYTSIYSISVGSFFGL